MRNLHLDLWTHQHYKIPEIKSTSFQKDEMILKMKDLEDTEIVWIWMGSVGAALETGKSSNDKVNDIFG